MEDNLADDLLILQNHLDGVLDTTQRNILTLQRLQSFEMKLMERNSLRAILELIFDDAKALFDLDVITCCLVDEKGALQQYLRAEGGRTKKPTELILLKDSELLTTTFGFAVKPYLGTYKNSKCAGFFSRNTKKPQSVIIIPLHRRGKYLGSLNFGSFNPRRFVGTMATDFVEHMAAIVSLCIENSLNFEMMRRTSLVDTLTGLNNRRFFEQRIEEEISRAQRNAEPLCCFIFDIDHLQAINATYGQRAGDRALAAVARTIKAQVRNIDVLTRYDGEEFVALLNNITESEALKFAERIRKAICEMVIEYRNQPIQLSISIGFACFMADQSRKRNLEQIASQLIDGAMSALDTAKHSGRNRVISGGAISLDSPESGGAV